MTDRKLIAKVPIKETNSLLNVKEALARFEAIPGVSAEVDLSVFDITLTVEVPASLEGAPHGDHSFAEGWLLADAVNRVERILFGSGLVSPAPDYWTHWTRDINGPWTQREKIAREVVR